MKKLIIPALLAGLIITACSSASTNIFGKKTPVEQYEDKLEESGLEKTPEGRQWMAAAENALLHPVTVQLPYSHFGQFSLNKPQALGLRFSAKQGERITFRLAKNEVAGFVLYAELYMVDKEGKPSLLQSPDTNVARFSYDVSEAGNYLLKIQPQLFRVGSYRLAISTGPSLAFPVAGKKAYIGSIWGDSRDGGKRSHEGVDIFAPKKTPAVAAADGYIVGVREGGIGGKTVWLRPEGKNYTLYYAHLDEQLVKEGQAVKKGDIIGLVGNTGNARSTPSHLHFGIYGNGGALDPFPFVNPKVKEASDVAEKKLSGYVRLLKDMKLGDFTAQKNTLLAPMAITAKSYIAELPGGRMTEVSFGAVQSATKPLKQAKATNETFLFSDPGAEPQDKKVIPAGSKLSVLGYFNEFAFVQSGEIRGWILEKMLKG